MASEGQKFIGRNRAPRVHITYENPFDAEKLVEIPFVMGVMADLSGNAAEPTRPKPEFEDRKFDNIDMDTFDGYLRETAPGVMFRVPNKLGDAGGEMPVKMVFRKMDDFGPAEVARQVPALAKLLDARSQLARLLSYADGKASAEETLNSLLSDPELMAALNKRTQAPVDEERS